MRYELKLAAESLEVLPLALIADAVARASATAGGTPFHRPAYRGKLGRIVEWVVDDARNGRIPITDQDGRPGSFDELVQRAKDYGTYSEVFRGPGSAEVDMYMTHALCIYTTLKNLNEWAGERGDEFSISPVGWIDERGWIEPHDVATRNPPTTDTPSGMSEKPAPEVEILRKRVALIAEFKDMWPSIENDLYEGSDNGLSESAKAKKHGYWKVREALNWAAERGKIRWDRAEAFVQAEGDSDLSFFIGGLLRQGRK